MDSNIKQIRATVKYPSSATAAQLKTHEVYAWAIENAFPELDSFLIDRYMRAWKVDRAKIDSLPALGWPSRLQNLIFSMDANKKFGALDGVAGFYEEPYLGYVFDLSDRFQHSGCLVPITDTNGLCIGVCAYRSADDEFPFLVRTHEERTEAA